jgi:hypothetical protein
VRLHAVVDHRDVARQLRRRARAGRTVNARPAPSRASVSATVAGSLRCSTAGGSALQSGASRLSTITCGVYAKRAPLVRCVAFWRCVNCGCAKRSFQPRLSQ